MEGSFSLALTILAVQRGFLLSWRSYLSFLPLGSLLGWSSIFSFESGGTFWDIQIKNVLGWNILRCSIVPWPSRQAGGENGVKLVSLRAESFCQTFSGQVQHFEHKNQNKKKHWKYFFIPLHVQVALFVKNENSVRAVPLLWDLFCTQRRKKSLHFVWGLRNPLWIVSLGSALSTLNSPNSLKQPTHSWIILEQGIQRAEKFLWRNKIWIYYTPSGVIQALLLCFFLHLDFTSNCWFHSRWFICLWVTWADYCGWVFVIS